VVSDWSEYMEYEDKVSKPAQSKARLKSQLLKSVLVLIGSADGSIQLWNPLQANELQEYIHPSG